MLDGYQKWIITFVKNCQLVPKCHFFFLPKFPLLVFGRYFNNSGFVNDPCSSLTFFHNTDNPRWVTLLFFNILKFIQVILSKSNNLLYIIKSCNYLGYLSNQRKLCLNFRFKLFQNFSNLFHNLVIFAFFSSGSQILFNNLQLFHFSLGIVRMVNLI